MIMRRHTTKQLRMVEEEKRLKASLERMRAAGKQIKGYDIASGRLRDVIASMLNMSKTKVAQIESVNNNLIPEFKEELKSDRLTFSAAYELSGMPEDRQKEALGQYKENGELSYKDIKNMKEEKAEGQDGQETAVKSEEIAQAVHNGLSQTTAKEADAAAGGEYQTPHTEGITSLCYSCKKYSDCNVKTGTCTKCDQYINKAESEKTEEQRYSEEQDKIDRETAKKLREQADEKKMENLPSNKQEYGQRVHQIRKSFEHFDDIANGKISFELHRNDRDYKVGDILEMIEFKNSRNTGRMVRVMVTYILEDFIGIEDGYCIMAIALINQTEEGEG